MGIYESNTVIFHGVTEESRSKIHSFLQGYLDLFQKHFGEDKEEGNVYIGGIPTYAFDLDMDYGPFPREEGYYVLGISPRGARARYWENAPGFFGIFLEQELCSKITWHQYWDQGEPNHIYMNDSTENVLSSWKHYEFVPGENGVPAEYDEENEDDDGEAFNQFVNEVMKGEREVEWKDGFPDYWHDRYQESELEASKKELDYQFQLWNQLYEFQGHILQEMSCKHMEIQADLNREFQHLELKLEAIMGKKEYKHNRGTSNSSTETTDDSPAYETYNKSCPNCHQPAKENSLFCEECGTKLDKAPKAVDLSHLNSFDKKEFIIIGDKNGKNVVVKGSDTFIHNGEESVFSPDKNVFAKDMSIKDKNGTSRTHNEDETKKNVCPNCHQPAPENAPFCEKCGTKL